MQNLVRARTARGERKSESECWGVKSEKGKERRQAFVLLVCVCCVVPLRCSWQGSSTDTAAARHTAAPDCQLCMCAIHLHRQLQGPRLEVGRSRTGLAPAFSTLFRDPHSVLVTITLTSHHQLHYRPTETQSTTRLGPLCIPRFASKRRSRLQLHTDSLLALRFAPSLSRDTNVKSIDDVSEQSTGRLYPRFRLHEGHRNQQHTGCIARSYLLLCRLSTMSLRR